MWLKIQVCRYLFKCVYELMMIAVGLCLLFSVELVNPDPISHAYVINNMSEIDEDSHLSMKR